MDFLNRCRTCLIKGNEGKEDLINITKYCVLGKSYKHVLLSLAPNMDKTLFTDDNCVCENCAETLRRSALLIHKCVMIERKLKTISSQLRKNKNKDVTEKNCIGGENVISPSVSRKVIIDDKDTDDCITRALEILNKGTGVSVDLMTAENINKLSPNDYTNIDLQHHSKEKSDDRDSTISPKSTNLLSSSLLDGVKKHNRVVSLNSSDRPVLKNQLSCLMEHEINILDLSRYNEEDGKDTKKRVILIGLDQPTKCPICSRSTKYSVHKCHKLLKQNVPKPVQKCNLCGKVVKASFIVKHLKRHEQKAQNAQPTELIPIRVQQKYTCQTCCEKFTSKEEFQLHLELHPPFVCEICSKRFVKRCSLKAHMVTHNDQNSYICEVCGRGFKDKGSLRVHLKSHRSDDQTYPCAHCPKVFKQKLRVVCHMRRVHEKKWRCQCPECGKMFSGAATLKFHIKLVHLKEKPHKCPICQKMFGRMDYLRTHIKSHNNVSVKPPKKEYIDEVLSDQRKGFISGKPAPCRYCGLLFADMIKLERHLKTHFRRYQCRFCPLTFAYKSFCVRHERTLHEGVMSNFFRCNVCWKKVASKEALDEHVNKHNKPRYTCDLCGMKFNRRFMLNHHILVDHSNMPTKDEVNEIVYNSLLEASNNVTDINPEDLLF